MGIFGGSSGLSPELVAQLAGGIVGFPRFPYVKTATVELSGVQVQVLPEAEGVVREILIKNTTNQSLILFLGVEKLEIGEILPGGYFWDSFNSGLPIELLGQGTVEIFVRQDQEIGYEIG